MMWIVALALTLAFSDAVAAQEPTAPEPDSAESQASSPATSAPAASDDRRGAALPTASPGRGAPGQEAAVQSDLRRLSTNFALVRGEAERDNAEAQYLLGLAY